MADPTKGNVVALVSLLVSIVGPAATYGALVQRVTSIEQVQDRIAAEHKELRTRQEQSEAETAVHLKGIDDSLTNLDRTLTRLVDRLDKEK